MENEVTDPEAIDLIIALRGLQPGDEVRFSNYGADWCKVYDPDNYYQHYQHSATSPRLISGWRRPGKRDGK